MDTVRIALFLASLNKLQVCAADVSCAFLQAKCKEKIWTRAGVEFGALEGTSIVGRVLVLNKALYGTRTASAAFYEACSKVLLSLGFSPSKADTDLWMKDQGKHYDYIATWADDLLILSHSPLSIVTKLKETYQLKGVGEPSYYLGGDLQKVMVDGEERWTTSAKTYIKRVCEKIEKLMSWKLRTFMSPEDPNFHPGLDDTDVLDEEGVSKFRMMVGSLLWVIVLGRFELCHAVQSLARYANMPREGHMKAMWRIFGFLQGYTKLAITYDTRMPDFSPYNISKYDWFRAYPGVTEEMPPDMPVPRGNKARVSGFFDASHASCLVTRRSVTGVLIFINQTPILWYSKRQATVETSTYGSELVAGRIACEMAIDIRYRLRMLGIPVVGSCLMFGDNQSMVTNVSTPGSSLKKRSLAIAYHKVRECVAAGIVDIIHCRTEHNLADLMTKALGPLAFQRLIKNITFPPIGTDSSDTGELNTEIVKCGKGNASRVVMEYPRVRDELYCPTRDYAEALADPYFIGYVMSYAEHKE